MKGYFRSILRTQKRPFGNAFRQRNRSTKLFVGALASRPFAEAQPEALASCPEHGTRLSPGGTWPRPRSSKPRS